VLKHEVKVMLRPAWKRCSRTWRLMSILTSNSIVDEAGALAQLQGDRDLFLELVGIFLEEAPEIMSRMVHSLSSGDLAELTGAAHKLKGCLPVIGGRVFVEATKRLEMTKGFENIVIVTEEVSSLQQGITRFTYELKALLDGHSPETSAPSFAQAYLQG
jgi:histidine phosphotransfer protein HptB